jgi:hypothetical protein
MTRAKFKKKWPNAKADGFDTVALRPGRHELVFELGERRLYPRRRVLEEKADQAHAGAVAGRLVEDLTDQLKDVPPDQAKAGLQWLAQQKQARIEERDSYKICRYMITMAEVWKSPTGPGCTFPIVPVIGEEVRIGREVYRHGVVRYARDPQRMENYYASAETEVIALQPKAPWLGTKKQFEQHYDLWETANTEAHPFLEYTVDPAAPGPPQRIQPPVGSTPSRGQASQLGRHEGRHRHL